MQKILLSLVSVFIFLILVLLIVPSFIDWSDYKEQIKVQISNATGYNVEINGELKAAFLPTPHININQVKIDSADVKGPFGFIGDVGNASVSLSLVPLLSGKVIISDVSFIDVDFSLKEQNKTAKKNKKTRAVELQETKINKESDKALDIQIDRFYLKNAKISYAPLTGDKVSVIIPTFELNAQTLLGPYKFDGNVNYNEIVMNLKGDIGEYSDVSPMSLSVTIGGDDYNLGFSGIVDLTKKMAEAQGEVTFLSKSLLNMAKSFGGSDLPIKDDSLKISGLLSGSSKSIKFDNGKIKFGALENPIKLSAEFMPDNKKGKISLKELPDNGSIKFDVSQSAGGVTLDGDVFIPSISSIASDWLGMVGAGIFENEKTPNSINGDIKLSLMDNMNVSSSRIKLGSYDLQNTLFTYVSGDNPVLDLSIGSFDGAKIKASGMIDNVNGLNVNISHSNGAEFIKIFQKDFKGNNNLTKPLSFKGNIQKDGGNININEMVAKIAGVDMQGLLSINSDGKIPSVKADVTFGTLDTQALMTGKASSAVTKKSSINQSSKNTKTSTVSPWTRDAIDTEFMRLANVSLRAKAKKLIHGSWIIDNPVIDLALNDGVLVINKINGGLYDGQLGLSGRVEAKENGKPINVKADVKIDNVNLAKFIRSATGQNEDRVIGIGSIDMAVLANGLSSSALIYSLNGDGNIKTSDLIVKGIDLAKVTEAIGDESLSDLVAVVKGAFKTGQTSFEPVDYVMKIREGTMPVENLTLKSETANLVSNGEISFARWNMNVKNTVNFTTDDDLPSVDMTIKGPLDSPKQNVTNDILTSFIKNKYGSKIQKKILEKLGTDSPVGGLLNNLLGLPQPKKTVTPDAPTKDPAANDNTQPATEIEPVPTPSLEEQLLQGLFSKF